MNNEKINENELWQVMIGQEIYQADNETLKQWINEGRLLADDKIKKGNLNWIEAKRVPTFRNLFSSALPNATNAITSSTSQIAPQDYENSNNQHFPSDLTNANQNQQPLTGYISEIRANQDLNMGIAAGITSAVIGAFIWAVFTAITEYQFVLMGILAGLFVGFSVRKFGKGIDTSFGVVGAICSLFCCLSGTILASCIMVAYQTGSSLLKIVFNLNFNLIMLILREGFGPIDILIYGFAIYEGYKISFRSDYDEN